MFFNMFFKKKKKSDEITIRESVTSIWFYHIAVNGETLCKTPNITMSTAIPVKC